MIFQSRIVYVWGLLAAAAAVLSSSNGNNGGVVVMAFSTPNSRKVAPAVTNKVEVQQQIELRKKELQQMALRKKAEMQQIELRKQQAVTADGQRLTILKELYELELVFQQVQAEKEQANDESIKMNKAIEEQKLLVQKSEIQTLLNDATSEVDRLSTPLSPEELDAAVTAAMNIPVATTNDDVQVGQDGKKKAFPTPGTSTNSQMVDVSADLMTTTTEEKTIVPFFARRTPSSSEGINEALEVADHALEVADKALASAAAAKEEETSKEVSSGAAVTEADDVVVVEEPNPIPFALATEEPPMASSAPEAVVEDMKEDEVETVAEEQESATAQPEISIEETPQVPEAVETKEEVAPPPPSQPKVEMPAAEEITLPSPPQPPKKPRIVIQSNERSWGIANK